MKAAIVLCAVGVLTQAMVADATSAVGLGRLTALLQGPGDGPALRTALFAYRNRLIDLLTEWFGHEDIPRYVQVQGGPYSGQGYGAGNDPFGQAYGGGYDPSAEGYGAGGGPLFSYPAGFYDPTTPISRGRRSPQQSSSLENGSGSQGAAPVATAETTATQQSLRTSGARSATYPSNLNGPINSSPGSYGYDPIAVDTVRSMRRQLENYIREIDQLLYDWYGYISYSGAPTSRTL